MDSSNLIIVDNISRIYRTGNEDFYALRDVSMSVAKQQLTILRGRSGSGKTTLINMLGALDRPTSGSVLFGEDDLTRMSDSARDEFRRVNVGFVFQSIALITTMSAYENVEFALRIVKVPHHERKERVEECLSLVGLEQRMYHRPHELSGGEQQRVAIARAIAPRPVVVFADEPTAELDTNTGLQVIRLFKKVIEEQNITIVMTTHDPNMMEVGDKVILLEDGKIVSEDTPDGSGASGSSAAEVS